MVTKNKTKLIFDALRENRDSEDKDVLWPYDDTRFIH